MSLIQYLITEGSLNVMVNKIGISEELAKIIQKNHSRKLQYVVASIISNGMDQIEKEGGIIREHYNDDVKWYERQKNTIDRFERFTKENNFPKINFNEFKTYQSYDLHNANEKLQSIKDYRLGAIPTPQLSNMTIEEAYEKAEEWHENLKAGGNALEIEDDQVVITQYEDGYFWLDIRDDDCKGEGDSMGHCGTTSSDTLLSLRDDKGVPHVTVAYNYDGTYTQMKGKNNKKPKEKYHEYILDLFIQSHTPVPDSGDFNEIYQIIQYEPEYDPASDFNVMDLDNSLFDRLKSEIREYEFLNLLMEIDYEYLLRSLDYENVNIRISTKDPRYVKAFKFDNYRKEEFIDLLIQFDLLDKRYKEIEFITNIQYPDVNIYNKEKVLQEVYNESELVLLRIMTDHFDEDLFYKRK